MIIKKARDIKVGDVVWSYACAFGGWEHVIKVCPSTTHPGMIEILLDVDSIFKLPHEDILVKD